MAATGSTASLARAADSRRGVKTNPPASASSTIMIGPPTNSATANCQPSRTSITSPSSTTRLVEAIMKTMALVKSAPLTNSDLAMADAAYEQEEETMP